VLERGFCRSGSFLRWGRRRTCLCCPNLSRAGGTMDIDGGNQHAWKNRICGYGFERVLRRIVER